MRNLTQEKYPQLWAAFEDLKKEKEALAARTAELHAKREAVREAMRPLDAEERDLSRQIHAIERPRMGELDTQIAALARAMGGRVMSEPEGES